MYLITCDFDCVYQKEGYCMLKSPSIITNQTGNGCVHYIKKCPGNPTNINKVEFNSSVQRPV